MLGLQTDRRWARIGLANSQAVRRLKAYVFAQEHFTLCLQRWVRYARFIAGGASSEARHARHTSKAMSLETWNPVPALVRCTGCDCREPRQGRGPSPGIRSPRPYSPKSISKRWPFYFLQLPQASSRDVRPWDRSSLSDRTQPRCAAAMGYPSLSNRFRALPSLDRQTSATRKNEKW